MTEFSLQIKEILNDLNKLLQPIFLDFVVK
jgi:hypothetical protein